MKLTQKFLGIFFISTFVNLLAQNTYYVHPTNGNDSNIGTKDLPFATLTKAAGIAVAGDTIYLRGGTYFLSSTISLGSSTKSGTSSNYYNVFAYKGEKPVYDFSKQTSSDGIKVNGRYWHLKGIESSYAAHNGIAINGSYNIIENCSVHDNRNSGMQFGNGASYNKIINCDSYYNFDPAKNGADADGFSPKLDTGTGNYFYGCRSWQNSDDGWDGYLRPSNDVTTTLENCWSFKNGFKKDGSDPGPQANGNGFKMGGSDDKTLMHNFILKNCLSFDNKVKGFDQNNNKGSMTIYNCTGFRNGTYNFSIPSSLNAGKTATVKNCISLLSQGISLMPATIQETNTWLPPFTVSADDFISIDTTGARGPRKSDGSLPDITFMHLKSSSALIDKGVNVGIPFTGSAPDLGAFEHGMQMPADVKENNILPTGFKLLQNYPNPFNPSTIIVYQLPVGSFVTLKIYDVLGKEIATLTNEYQPAGIHRSAFSVPHSTLSSGIYFYQLRAGQFVDTKKLMLMK